ncbi:efflux RND transporter periplasmic adaptor subunit [Azospirillum halopraeferens]|uniref:efflux RND transporter periplasmic adaptor subunit n=1 Tax=Azospirillum halopraeferens TaxID=34010 RepID=UPI00040956C9|nr:HlyD family efflux transporter periplasmic adaptor subunit [Azospirillum halopraeferens]
MSVLRTLLVIPPLAAGIALVAVAAANRPAPARTTAVERTVVARTVTVEPVAFVPRVIGYGTVQPARTWNAVAQVAGRVERLAPEFVRGAFVPAGTELARIAPEDFELAIAQADAAIATADANIEELAASAGATRASLAIERDALNLEAQDVERQRALLARGSASASAVEQRQSSLLRQTARVQELENALALVPAKLRALEQQRALSLANRRIAELNLERTVIRAPFAARVAAVNVEATQFVGVGAVLGTFDGIDASEVDVQIAQTDMRDFAGLAALNGSGSATTADIGTRIRLPATVRLRVGDRTIAWDGHVHRVSDAVDPKTRTVGVIVAVENPYRDVVPGVRPPLIKGMFVEVEVRGAPVPGSIVVPRAAVSNGLVHVADPDDRLAVRPVRVAYTFRDAAVITEGLAPGDRVVIGDLAPALPGMKLVPVRDEERERSLRALAGAGDAP